MWPFAIANYFDKRHARREAKRRPVPELKNFKLELFAALEYWDIELLEINHAKISTQPLTLQFVNVDQIKMLSSNQFNTYVLKEKYHAADITMFYEQINFDYNPAIQVPPFVDGTIWIDGGERLEKDSSKIGWRYIDASEKR